MLVNLLSLSVFFKKSSEDSLSAHPQNLKLSQQKIYINVKLTIQSSAGLTLLEFLDTPNWSEEKKTNAR